MKVYFHFLLACGYNRCMRKKLGALRKRSGFTILEMIVSIAIITLISAQVLVSFSGLNEASTLNRAAQELAFNIRRAQNMSLAVAPVNIGGTLMIPQAVGIRISSQISANSYFFFADQDKNGTYDDPVEQIEPIIILPGSIRIASVTGEIPGNPGVHIIFYTPEATLAVTDFIGARIPNFIDITLQGTSGAIKIVRIRMSGQVSVL